MEFVNEQNGGRNFLKYAMPKDFEELEKFILNNPDYNTKEKIQANITRYTKDDIELWDWVKIMKIDFEQVKDIIDNIKKKKPKIYSRIQDGLILSLSRCFICYISDNCCRFNDECGNICFIRDIIIGYNLDIDKVQEMSIKRENYDNNIDCNKNKVQEECNKNNKVQTGGYYNKYLKYKNKYLNLKRQLNL
jgi:hypothetical protein